MNTQTQQDLNHEQLLEDFMERSRFRSEVYQEVLKYAAFEALRRPPPVASAPSPPRAHRIGELCWLATKKAGRWLYSSLSKGSGDVLSADSERAGQPIIIDVRASEPEMDEFSLFILTDPFSIDEEE